MPKEKQLVRGNNPGRIGLIQPSIHTQPGRPKRVCGVPSGLSHNSHKKNPNDRRATKTNN